MLTPVVQRWRDQRGTYRPVGEPIDTRRYEVAVIEGDGSDRIAKGFVRRHHYSASYPAARHRFGLYRGPELVGVAVFSQPANNATLAVFPGGRESAIELGRLVLLE